MIVFRSMSAALKLALLFVVSFSLFTLYGRCHFYRDPGSIFFDQARAYERRYSNVRLRQVELLRNSVISRSDRIYTPEPATRKTSPEICVTITTFFRHGLERQYVEDTIFSLLDGITARERDLLHLNLLFTDLEAAAHPSWHRPWLRAMLDNVWSYEDIEDTSNSLALRSWLKDTNATSVSTKAMVDYTLALQKCLDHTDAPYIAVFEGDTLFAAGWVAPTLRALKSADRFLQQRAESWWTGTSKPARDWSDMRIFNQERSTGWASKKVGGNNELAIVLVVYIAIGLAILLLRSRSIICSHNLDQPTLVVVLLLIIPVSVVSFFQAGKASLLPPRPGLVVENFGCCSQALIFNRKHVLGLIEYLRDFAMREMDGKSEQVQYDMRTRDFASENGLDRLALYPMQVQHMGIRSAVGASQTEAQSVWSMAFEDLEDKDVRTRHENAMDQLFGTEWRS